ncbi:MAG: 50S ribosome-binding GTPase [Planctomycetales bacterium]|nr:50S ribosome-binding GTPase [Planctomycetales bacterium]
MKLELGCTIVAVGSGNHPSQRAIVRISGEETQSILQQLITCQDAGGLLAASHAQSASVRCSLAWPEQDVECQVYFWPTRISYTGEPSAEIHVIGSMPIVESLVSRITQLGAKPAERGEFTLRGFLNGKLDLAQAEAVLGVIEADNSAGLNWALGQLAGNLSGAVRQLREQLVGLLSHLEAGLDFVEEDIEFIHRDEIITQLQSVADALLAMQEQLAGRLSRKQHPSVVLVGFPNAGKSSLFNALLGRARTIVSNVAGTTRDVITANCQLKDMEVELVDTAGIEDYNLNSPRGLAQEKLVDHIQQAALLLTCHSTESPAALLQSLERKLESVLRSRAADLADGIYSMPPRLQVITKSDLSSSIPVTEPDCRVSVSEPNQLAHLRELIYETLWNSAKSTSSHAMHCAIVRCNTSLHLATEDVRRALQLATGCAGEELIATEIRVALDNLGMIIGEIHSDEILGEIFGRFCIGK